MLNISLDAIDTINAKLGQADAITMLLRRECDEVTKLSDELRSYALWALTDLIIDSKKLLDSEIERGSK